MSAVHQVRSSSPRFSSHRLLLFFIALSCFAVLAAGIALQEFAGLVPCPMCIVQRYALILTGVFCLVSASFKRAPLTLLFGSTANLMALSGAFVAARQSWLQWHPPEIASCGRDFYGMIETFPLKRAVPMIFKGSGDCTKVDWTFLGGSIANWSFVFFVATSLALAVAGYLALVDARLSRIHNRGVVTV